MNKILKHLKNNAAIYLVLITCLVVILVILFVNKPESKEVVDTSFFNKVNLNEALELFESNEPKFLLMSVYYCTATMSYVPSLQIAIANYHFPVYYLELTEIDTSSSEFQELLNKLDLQYEFQGKVDKFSTFIENTPLTVIIKNRKMVRGYIGSMNSTTIKSLVDAYELSGT